MAIVLLAALVFGAYILALVLRGRRIVHEREAVLITDRATGSVRRLVAGPGRIVLRPGQEALSLDLSTRRSQLAVDDAISADRLGVFARLDVRYALDPTLLAAANLNQIVPSLTRVKEVVEAQAAHIVRALALGYPLDRIMTAALRARLERQLSRTLQTDVNYLGVCVRAVRLTLRPDAKIIEAHREAQQRAEMLAILSKALGPDAGHLFGQVLPWEILETLQQDSLAPTMRLDGRIPHAQMSPRTIVTRWSTDAPLN